MRMYHSRARAIWDEPLQEYNMTPLESIESSIAELPPEDQIRVNAIADMLRAMLCHDEDGETELAMLLVMEELNDDSEAMAHLDETVQ